MFPKIRPKKTNHLIGVQSYDRLVCRCLSVCVCTPSDRLRCQQFLFVGLKQLFSLFSLQTTKNSFKTSFCLVLNYKPLITETKHLYLIAWNTLFIEVLAHRLHNLFNCSLQSHQCARALSVPITFLLSERFAKSGFD